MIKRQYILLVFTAMLIMACSCGSLSSLLSATSTPSSSNPGGDTTLTPPSSTSGPNPAYSQAQQLAGQWNGTWSNTTYGTTGKITATITIQPDGTATANVTLGGNILGVGSPSPLTFAGTYDANGLAFGGTGGPIFGDLQVTIDYSGNLTMTANNLPVPGISQVSAQGTMSGTDAKLTYTVTFATGTSASGIASMTKTP